MSTSVEAPDPIATAAQGLSAALVELVRAEVQRQLADGAQPVVSMPAIDPAEWLTLAEAAAIARRSTQTLYQAIYAGELAASQRTKGAAWRMQRGAVQDWMTGRGRRSKPSRGG